MTSSHIGAMVVVVNVTVFPVPFGAPIQKNSVAEYSVELECDAPRRAHTVVVERSRRQTRMPIVTPTASIATSTGEPCRPATKVWWISSETA